MSVATMEQGRRRATKGRAASAPVPREHGAWVMLGMPYLIGVLLGGRAGAVPLLLLGVAGTAAFLAQDIARRFVRGRRPEGISRWLRIYAAVTAVSGGALLLVVDDGARIGLLEVGAIAVVLGGALLWGLAQPTRKRFDRSVFGELLAVPALTLAGPAAVVLGRGGLTAEAWALWGLCIAYFGSGVLFVKMLLDFAKRSRRGGRVADSVVARVSIAYHALLTALLAVGAVWLGAPGLWVMVGFAPVITRTGWGLTRLHKPLPKMVTVGVIETVYSAWFAFCTVMALG